VRELRPLDVVLAAVRFGMVDYPRHCIVIAVRRDGVILTPCSTKQSPGGRDFAIYDDDLDFEAAGFRESSYVSANEETPWLSPSLVRKRYGRLTGDLARRFCEWYGAELA